MPRLKQAAPLGLFFICSFLSTPAFASNDILKKLYLKEKKLKQKPEGISLSGEFGVLVANGNTNTTTIKAALSSEHEMQRWSNNYHSELIYKQNKINTTTFVTAQRFLVNAQLDYKLPSNNNRLFVYAEYEDDRFNGFRYQGAVAAGYSSHAWKNKESQLRYSIGPGYAYSEREIIDLEEKTLYEVFNEVIIRASLDYKFSINKSAKFRQFVSTEAGQQSNRSRSETTLTASLIDSLAMKLSFVMIYNDGTLKTNEDLSTETSISLVYQFF
jgi:putative salt-induced outer membrane protein YdiY